MKINIEGWNKINEFKDCPPLNKKVLAIHDNKIYISIFERDGSKGYCWKLENKYGIEWVDVFEVDAWLSIGMLAGIALIVSKKGAQTWTAEN